MTFTNIKGKDVMRTDGERLASLEAKADFYDKVIKQNADSLERLSESVRQLVALEERHQALDRRHEGLRNEFIETRKDQYERLKRTEDIIQLLNTNTELNSHGRDIWERFLIPAIGGISSGIVVAGTIYFLF